MQIGEIFIDLLIILAIVIANAFFVAAEFAIVKVRSTQIQTLAQKNNRLAKYTLKILDKLDSYLSASQVGITMTSLGLGWVGEPITAKLLEPIFTFFGIENPQTVKTLSIIIGFIFLTFLHISLGEQAPKMLAIKSPKNVSMWVSVPLNIFYVVFKPIIWLLNEAANLILKLIGIKQVSDSERISSEEELRLIISEGRKSGAIDQTEHQLIEKIFEFNDKQASEIMVPRNHMAAINIDDTRENIFRIVTEEGYSRLPVYKDTIDNIIGIIYTKDLISAAEHRELIALQDIIRPAYFVSSTKQIGNLLKDMQRAKVHMGIVVDEYGGVEGLVTIEDIIEEIVGEIQDEYDIDETQEVISEKSGVYLVNPIITIENFNSRFKTNIPQDPDYKTLSGFLQKITGHIPDINEKIEYEGISFVVTKKSGNQILQLRVQKQQMK